MVYASFFAQLILRILKKIRNKKNGKDYVFYLISFVIYSLQPH